MYIWVMCSILAGYANGQWGGEEKGKGIEETLLTRLSEQGRDNFKNMDFRQHNGLEPIHSP